MSDESQRPGEDEIAPGEEAGDDLVPADDLLADEPAAIREELRRKLKTQGARVAYDCMVAVASDPKAQASARATCAVALFRGAGFLGKRADEEDASDGKSLDQMSAAEMDAELKRLRARRLKNEKIIRRASSDEDEDVGSVFD
jgi:hypothetical protein